MFCHGQTNGNVSMKGSRTTNCCKHLCSFYRCFQERKKKTYLNSVVKHMFSSIVQQCNFCTSWNKSIDNSIAFKFDLSTLLQQICIPRAIRFTGLLRL